MRQSGAIVAPPQNEALIDDVGRFIGIVEQTAERVGSADGWRFAADYAANGLAAGWDALLSPQGEERMPVLRAKVADHLEGMGLSMQAMSKRKPPLKTLMYIAPTVLAELYDTQPDHRRRPEFLSRVAAEVSPISTLRFSTKASARNILAGMRAVLGTKSPGALRTMHPTFFGIGYPSRDRA